MILTNKDLKRKYTIKKDNKMRAFGDTDLAKKVIRINKKKSKKSKRTGEVLDTIVHEVTHAKHPKMYERTVRKHTTKLISHLTRKTKSAYYKLVS